ncbi:MAG: carboxylating nicotinate-nucleotide diphosphorylase [Bdellovibrionaceae bacterium]|nr:carboxylating nicotinate-nucleotide diphosphorylase [Pseudobdellovibrionaceae bacterium]
MKNIQEWIKMAFEEDLPSGDLTTDNLAMPPRAGTARLIAKQDLILSGYQLFETAVIYQDPSAKLKWHFIDGQKVLKGQIICSLYGDLVSLLKAERVGLNFLMHLSGIATLTHQFVQALQGTHTKILDTRKTLPGYRELEKKAVRDGGGENHRMNLSTAILIKDNHIALCGGITEAVNRIRQHTQEPITVEASTKEQVEEAVSLGVKRILLDNMSMELLQEVLPLIPDDIETEASGNMTLERVRQIAELGVDYISVGAITHSAPSADVSLLFDWQ